MRDDPNRLRHQASRLLALALVSREQGQVEYSDRLAQNASEMLLRAEEIERSIGNGRGV
jgi:HEPN domain-containing protein